MRNVTPWAGLGRRSYNRVSDSYKIEPRSAPRPGGRSKTQTLRDLIREHGRLKADQLATLAYLESSGLVGALLKHDIALERIRREGPWYCWNSSYEGRLREALADAVKLLRHHGYAVEAPKP